MPNQTYRTGPPPTGSWSDEDQARWQQSVDAVRSAPDAAFALNEGKREKVLAELERIRAERIAASEKDYYSWLGREYGAIGTEDPTVKSRAADLSAGGLEDIDRGEQQGIRSIARGTARSGVRSGYAEGQKQDLWTRSSLERANLRRSAIEQAVGLEQQRVAGEAQTRGYGMPIVQQMLGSAEQRYQHALDAEAKRRDEFMRFIGQLGGTAAGYYLLGPAGAASKAGGSSLFSASSGASPGVDPFGSYGVSIPYVS